MWLMGDVHGKWQEMQQICKYKKGTGILIGDIGVGFPRMPKLTLPDNVFMIAGNHDSPEVIRAHPNYLGNYGSREIDGHRTFFMGGAWSIDQAWRTEGQTWWRDEELSMPELYAAHDEYVDYKPEIMISHDGPSQATTYLLNELLIASGSSQVQSPISTRTGQALSAMFDSYQPKIWIFGHWHLNWRKEINGTLFICLNELQTLDLETERLF
jgi:predicted phosphodiesterase